MKRQEEDSTTGIIQHTVKHYGKHVIKNTVKETLKSHTDYPTFKSICDSIKKWHVEKYPVRYEIDNIRYFTGVFKERKGIQC